MKRILRYLKGTIDDGLVLKKPTDLLLQGYSDSDCASDSDDRKSTPGLCIYFGGNLIQWSSKKQSVISRSSIEAEYRSLAHVSADLVWLKSLFADLHIHISTPPTIWCDNLSAVHLSANPVLHS